MSYDLTAYLLRPGIRHEDIVERNIDEDADWLLPLPEAVRPAILDALNAVVPNNETFDNGEGFEWSDMGDLGLQVCTFAREASASFAYWEHTPEQWQRLFAALDGFIRACRAHGLTVYDTQLGQCLDSAAELEAGLRPQSPESFFSRIVGYLGSLRPGRKGPFIE